MEMKLCGKAWLVGKNVDTGTIISARFMTKTDNSALGQYCLVDLRPDFTAGVKPGDILVAGENFGCGSAREQAPVALKECVSCVIAESFARIFYRNAIGLGYYAIELPDATKRIREGDIVEVNMKDGRVVNKTKNESYDITPFPKFLEEIYAAGGLLGYIGNKISEQ
jgi:3-isopropylmalate dehydratase small subunit